MKIKYEFVDGEVELEVSDEWASVLAELDRAEYNNNQRETRRHTSLDNGFDDSEWLAIDDENIKALFIDSENHDRLYNAMEHLSDKQRALVKAVYFDGISVTKYAELVGVTKGAISQQLHTVRKKLKKFF